MIKNFNIKKLQKLAQARGFWSGVEPFIFVAKSHPRSQHVLSARYYDVKRGLWFNDYSDTHDEGVYGHFIWHQADMKPLILLTCTLTSEDKLIILRSAVADNHVHRANINDWQAAGQALQEKLNKLNVKLADNDDINSFDASNDHRGTLAKMGIG